MLSIIKEGRAAFIPGGNPGKLCPYKIALSPEQLAWSIGYYKAEADYWKAYAEQIQEAKRDIIEISVFNTRIRGELEFQPGIPVKTLNKYVGPLYRAAYCAGWAVSQERYEQSKLADWRVERNNLQVRIMDAPKRK